jgi:hypothetical protein
MEKFFFVCQLFAAHLLYCWCMPCGVVRVKTQVACSVRHGCLVVGFVFLLFGFVQLHQQCAAAAAAAASQP